MIAPPELGLEIGDYVRDRVDPSRLWRIHFRGQATAAMREVLGEGKLGEIVVRRLERLERFPTQ